MYFHYLDVRSTDLMCWACIDSRGAFSIVGLLNVTLSAGFASRRNMSEMECCGTGWWINHVNLAAAAGV